LFKDHKALLDLLFLVNIHLLNNKKYRVVHLIKPEIVVKLMVIQKTENLCSIKEFKVLLTTLGLVD